jgi:aspartyl-tRNA(Asn)/glutamyl-tRNA(Gln) amidotransferase subunit B
VGDGLLSSNTTKLLMEELLQSKKLPENVVQYAESAGYTQVSDNDELERIVETVIAANPKPADDVRAGELKAIGFLVGQTMKESAGKANPSLVQDIIKKKLGL